MRWLIGVLLVLNVVFALWQRYFDQPTPAAPPLPDVGHLRLLSERSAGQAPANPARPVVQTAAVATASAPHAAAQTAPTPAPTVSTAASPPPAPKRAPTAPAQVCWQLPAAGSRDVAQRIADDLPPSAHLLGIVTQQVPEVSAYYVMIPPARSRARAEATIARLARKGIKDTWMIPDGPKRNAISLGLFSEQDNADAYVRSIRDKGFDAVVEPKHRIVPQYAVQVRADKSVEPGRLQQLLPGDPIPIACP